MSGKGFWSFLALIISSISNSHRFADAAEIRSASLDDFWKTTVPTYVMNWAQHQGTVADLEKSSSYGPSGEGDMLASWAAASDPFEVDQFARWNQVHVFKANPCAPRRWCAPYSTGYVFNAVRKQQWIDLQSHQDFSEFGYL